MKVCMVTSFRPAHDGVGDAAMNLMDSMKKIDNMEISVITHVDEKAPEEPRVHRTIHKKRGERSVLQILREVAGKGLASEDARKTVDSIDMIRPDIVHVQYEPGMYNLFFVPELLSRLKKKGYKTVVTLHGRDYFPLTIFHKIFLYGKPDSIIVHTDTHMSKLPKSAQKKTKTIAMGINPIKHDPDRAIYSKTFLFFGFMSPHKGVEILLNAFQKLYSENKDAKLIIHGSINEAHMSEVAYREKIKAMIKSLGIEEGVSYRSEFTPRESLPNIDSSISVFPYMKSYSAGQSEALLDSISVGNAVIVSRVPGLYERVIEGNNGLIVEPENVEELYEAMSKLFDNDDLVLSMREENLKLTEALSWDNIAEQTVEFYESVAKG